MARWFLIICLIPTLLQEVKEEPVGTLASREDGVKVIKVPGGWMLYESLNKHSRKGTEGND